MKLEDLESVERGEGSQPMADRVAAARKVQAERYGGARTNASLSPRELESVCSLPKDAAGLLRRAMKQLGLSARSRARLLKLGRTLADLAGSESVKAEHTLRRQFNTGYWTAGCGLTDEDHRQLLGV